MTYNIIAEIANVHEGDCNYAIELVRSISTAIFHSVKIQIIFPDEICVRKHPDFLEFSRLSLGKKGYEKLANEVNSINKLLIADVFGSRSLKLALDMKVDGIKIHASDLLNHRFIKEVSINDIPIFLSTGGGNLVEIHNALTHCQNRNRVVLVTGTQNYPTLIQNTDLWKISFFKKKFNLPICFSDHIDGDNEYSIIFPLVAIGMGATYIEKHITLDRTRRFDDDHSALEPNEFIELCKKVQLVGEKFTIPDKMTKYLGDWNYRKKAFKSPVFSKNMKEGEIISHNNIEYRRIMLHEVNFNNDEHYLNKKLKFNVKKGEPLRNDLVETKNFILLAARMNSSRLPGKVLKKIMGMSAIELLIKRLKWENDLPIVLSTTPLSEDNVLLDIAKKNDIYSFKGHPNDILNRYLMTAEHYGCDNIIRCTADNLFVDPCMINDALKHHLKTNSQYTRTLNLIDGADFEIISIEALRTLMNISIDTSKSEYLTWYLDRNELFNIEYYVPHNENYNSIRLTLDTKTDLKNIKYIFNKIGHIFFNYHELISTLIDLNFQLPFVNNDKNVNKHLEIIKTINLNYKFI